MATIALTGQDTLKINNRPIFDFADGDAGTLTFAASGLVTIKTGLNGNSIYSFSDGGRQCTLVLRLIRGSRDDRFLNRMFAIMKADFASFILFNGELVKRIGDGNGGITEDIYSLSGGVFAREVDIKATTAASVEQPVATWTLLFNNAPRMIM